MNQKDAVFLPLGISVFLYLCIVFGVFYYVNYSKDSVKRYSSKKDNFLEVSMISKPKEQKSVIQKIKKQKKQEIEKTEAKTSVKQNDKIKDLFGKVKTKDLNRTKKIPINNKDKTVQSRLKPKKSSDKSSKKASKLINSLSFEDSPSMASSSGEYDEFYGKVQETLDGFWQQTIETQSGAEAKVKINIDAYGHFSYNIVEFSYNDTFNKKLRDFLEQMRSVTFPKNRKKASDIVIKFTDRLER